MGHSPQHMANGVRQSHLTNQTAGRSLGLRGVVCGETTLIPQSANAFLYRDYSLSQLLKLPFETVGHLLFHGSLPTFEAEADLASVLMAGREIDSPLVNAVTALPLQTRALDLLPVSISFLSCFDAAPSDDQIAEGVLLRFWRLFAQLPSVLHAALGGKIQFGVPEFANFEADDYATQLLAIVRNDEHCPTAADVEVFQKVLICQCLTAMRPAGFAARLVGSQSPSLVAAVQSAATMFTAQLRNDPFAWIASTLSSFSTPNAAVEWWAARQNRNADMPFGFANQPDPKAEFLLNQSESLLESFEHLILDKSARRLESLLEEHRQYPTVDWAAARILAMLNVPADRISLVIGIARMIGWAAEAFEQHKSGVSLLPHLRYHGS